MQNETIPITELSNEITKSLDKSSCEEIVQLFGQVDSQMFFGYSSFPSVSNLEILNKICKLGDSWREALKNQRKIILSGCGTSGRLSFINSHFYNKILGYEAFHYLCAGGDKALVKSEELVEDSTDAGKRDLMNIVGTDEEYVYVGISCGISAAYVAGQLDACHSKSDSFLIGFNPLDFCRKTKISGWDKSFGEYCREGKFTIINPVVGPEAITGSSRMKGGSMTKIILDTAFLLTRESKSSVESVRGILSEYLRSTFHVYSLSSKIGSLIKEASIAKRVLYTSSTTSSGLFGFLDASECPPTFGCDFNDVRCFIKSGWKSFHNREGDLSSISATYNIESFEPIKGDLNISIEMDSGSTVLITSPDNYISIALDIRDCILKQFCSQFALKIILNAISSGAFIKRGMVVGNRMINLRVSNRKLYDRAIGIVQHITNTSWEKSHALLLESIYKGNPIKEIEDSIRLAQKQNNIIPLAVLLNSLPFDQAITMFN